MWTEDQKKGIVRQYFLTLSQVRCPDDQAFLDITDDWRIDRIEAFIFCPFCKQQFDWQKTEQGESWTGAQKETFIKNELRGKASECPNCGSLIEVQREREYGSGDRLTYIIKCRYCRLMEQCSF